MTLDEQRKQLVAEIARDRLFLRSLMIPQILLVAAAAALLSVVTAFGLYTAVITFRDNPGLDVLQKGASVFVGGSSTVLGFVVTNLLVKLREMTNEFMAGLRRFTSFTARAKAAATLADFDAVMREYGL